MGQRIWLKRNEREIETERNTKLKSALVPGFGWLLFQIATAWAWLAEVGFAEGDLRSEITINERI